MKTVAVLIIIFHGLIHLIGFLKAFRLAKIRQLFYDVSKPIGIMWLLVTITFLVAASMLMAKSEYWWVPSIIGILFSQILIFTNWKDTKVGTTANIIIFCITVIGYGSWSFGNTYKQDVKRNLLTQNTGYSNSLLTETDIQHLPNNVKSYIRYTKAIGKPKISNFKAKIKGFLRKSENTNWMPFCSEQYNFLKNPTRLFLLDAKMYYLPVKGYHSYKDGKAVMDIRLLSLLNVQYQEGKEMEIAETVTYFNDMCLMAPSTLIDNRIQWSNIEDNKVKATFTNNDIRISAWLFFNNKGQLINFISDDRFATMPDNKLMKHRWSTPIKYYSKINDFILPGEAKAVYHYPEGDLNYGIFKIKDIAYNCIK